MYRLVKMCVLNKAETLVQNVRVPKKISGFSCWNINHPVINPVGLLKPRPMCLGVAERLLQRSVDLSVGFLDAPLEQSRN